MRVPQTDLIHGDAPEVLGTFPDGNFDVCVTSPPYFGVVEFTGDPDELGLEVSVGEYVERLTGLFREVRRVLADDGVLWLNLGDTFNSYAGTAGPGSTKKFLRRAAFAARPKFSGLREKSRKPKDLLGVPWRVALALQADGWYLRSEIIWRKRNPAPEPAAVDRPWRAHENVFLLTKRERGTRSLHNEDAKWSVWDDVENTARAEWHPADFPPALAKRCLRSTRLEETSRVLDPFVGSGTTCLVANQIGLDSVGIDKKSEYVRAAAERVHHDCPMFSPVNIR